MRLWEQDTIKLMQEHYARGSPVSDTTTMIKALRVLSRDIQSGDGVANACVYHAADMIESISTQLAKANERVKELESQFETQMTNDFVTITDQAKRIAELEGAILDLCSTYHFEPDLSQPAKSLRELLRINSKCTLDPAISSDANKFAIEKKIEVLQELSDEDKNGTKHVFYRALRKIEQLRKEQDKC